MNPEQITASLLNNWSACMSLTNFQTAKMTNFATMQTNEGSTCEACHATGQSSMIASEVDNVYFDTISRRTTYLPDHVLHGRPDLNGLRERQGRRINTDSFAGVSKGQEPHAEHPLFNSTTNAGMTALDDVLHHDRCER